MPYYHQKLECFLLTIYGNNRSNNSLKQQNTGEWQRTNTKNKWSIYLLNLARFSHFDWLIIGLESINMAPWETNGCLDVWMGICKLKSENQIYLIIIYKMSNASKFANSRTYLESCHVVWQLQKITFESAETRQTCLN